MWIFLAVWWASTPFALVALAWLYGHAEPVTDAQMDAEVDELHERVVEAEREARLEHIGEKVREADRERFREVHARFGVPAQETKLERDVREAVEASGWQ